jgi:DNA-binding NarL/FixJ family response regulator
VKTVRVVLAEDNTLLRQGIERLIAAEPGLELVGTAEDLPALLGLVDAAGPDVVVTDIRMPPTGTDEGVQAATHLREHHPDVGVVVLSQYANPEYAMALLSHGSARRAYLLKDSIAGVDELVRAIRSVADGGSMVDPAVVDSLVGASKPERPSDLDRLTVRERETLAEMAQGKNNAAIAASLFLSERAVEKHTNSIFSKLGLTEEEDVNRRVKAVLIFVGAQPVATNG